MLPVHEWQMLLIERPETNRNELEITARLKHPVFRTICTLNRWRRTRKPACEEQKVRTFTTLGRLLVEVRSSCLCSCTNDWYSDLWASISAPSPNLSLAIHQATCQKVAWGHVRLHQPKSEGKNNLTLGLLWTLRQQLTTHSSQNPRETSWNLAWTLSRGRNFPPFKELTAPEYQQGNDLLQGQQT